MYERILVALDGSPAAERVLAHAEALATAFGSHVTLLRATLSAEMIGPIGPPIDPEPMLEADQETAADYLARVAATLKQRNLDVDTETPEGPAHTVIIERAAAVGAGLILMTTHGRSGLGRMVFGSTADSVLRHSACPVLLVRITDQDDTLKAT
jgi:nucleotide-binding universal stress UspA family protein